ALGWSPQKQAAFILGHGENVGESHVPVKGPRLAFIPLPSIESRGGGHAQVVGGIRRVLIAVLGGQADTELSQIARLLSGAELLSEGRPEPVALLGRIPKSDKMVRRYTDAETTWATVTPVILPGYDDPRKLRTRLFPKSESREQRGDERVQKELHVKL